MIIVKIRIIIIIIVELGSQIYLQGNVVYNLVYNQGLGRSSRFLGVLYRDFENCQGFFGNVVLFVGVFLGVVVFLEFIELGVGGVELVVGSVLW